MPKLDRTKLLQQYDAAMRDYSAAVAELDRPLSHDEVQAALQRAKIARLACERYRAMLEQLDRENPHARSAGQGEE